MTMLPVTPKQTYSRIQHKEVYVNTNLYLSLRYNCFIIYSFYNEHYYTQSIQIKSSPRIISNSKGMIANIMDFP